MNLGTKIALGVIAFIVFCVACWFIGYYIKWGVAPWQGRLEARQEIYSGEFMMTAYDHFFDLNGIIEGNKRSVCNTERTLAATTSTCEQERLRTVILGLENQIARDVQEYNYDAQKDWTIGQFRDAGLPFSVNASINCNNYQ